MWLRLAGQMPTARLLSITRIGLAAQSAGGAANAGPAVIEARNPKRRQLLLRGLFPSAVRSGAGRARMQDLSGAHVARDGTVDEVAFQDGTDAPLGKTANPDCPLRREDCKRDAQVPVAR